MHSCRSAVVVANVETSFDPHINRDSPRKHSDVSVRGALAWKHGVLILDSPTDLPNECIHKAWGSLDRHHNKATPQQGVSHNTG